MPQYRVSMECVSKSEGTIEAESAQDAESIALTTLDSLLVEVDGDCYVVATPIGEAQP